MAITCPNCHFAGNIDSAERCQQCNTLLRPMQLRLQPEGRMQGNDTIAVGTQSTSQEYERVEPPIGENARQGSGTITDQLVGRITWTENTSENIDFNYYRFFSQLILFLMFLPFLVAVFSISFVLWIALAILGFGTLSRDVSPFNIANTINSFGILLAVIFPRVPQRNQVPCVRMTIQSSNGERPALIKGELISGTFRRGDEIELNGEWRNGTLIMHTGYNRTLQTSLNLRRDYWRFVLIGLLGLLTIILIFVLVSYR